MEPWNRGGGGEGRTTVGRFTVRFDGRRGTPFAFFCFQVMGTLEMYPGDPGDHGLDCSGTVRIPEIWVGGGWKGFAWTMTANCLWQRFG